MIKPMMMAVMMPVTSMPATIPSIGGPPNAGRGLGDRVPNGSSRAGKTDLCDRLPVE